MTTYTKIFEPNVLNHYDNFTYNWTMYMVHPAEAHLFEGAVNQNRVVILAQTGVESEINIQSVDQSLVLGMKKNKDRNGMANMFTLDILEPGGATFFNRILLAAKRLNIENHLHACYLLELRFKGYDETGNVMNDPAGPFYYMCSMTALNFDYREGATQYRADLIETHTEAFKHINLHVKEQLTIEASTLGTFLSKLEKKIQDQEDLQTSKNRVKEFPDHYKFGFSQDTAHWASWTFGSPGGSGDPRLSNTSVTASGGGLVFTLPQGTQINTAIVVAILHTKNMQKLPTGKDGSFHKKDGKDGEADPLTFKELSSWFVFETNTIFEVYDPKAKRYAKTMEYNIKKYVIPELNHDSVSYDKLISDNNLQIERMKEIVKNGLLRKRFDYTYTGLNTEVLNLDVQLNNTYYQLQTINHGHLSSMRSSAFSSLPADQQNVALENSRMEEIQEEITETKSAIRKAQNDIERSKKLQTGESEALAIPATQVLAEANERLRLLKVKESEQLKKNQEAYRNLNRANQKLPAITERYITQSEVSESNKSFKDSKLDLLLPLTYEMGPVDSTATQGPDDNEPEAALMLGAVELNLNSLADLVQQQISIRGDPYWLGRPKGFEAKLDKRQANYTRGGCNYFLNLNFPTYPDYQTGLMDVSEQNYGIIGIYRVTRVDARYADGQFTMTLDAFRDMNTNLSYVYDFLAANRIELDEQRTLESEYKKKETDETEDNSENIEQEDGPGPDKGPDVNNGGASGNVTESQSGIRDQAITNDLKAILSNAATETGLDVVVYSGGQPENGVQGVDRTGSKRHDNGRAADVHLFAGTGSSRRKLSLNNPADVPLIQSYLSAAKRYGATGIGAGNGYMGNDGFHIDNAFPNNPAYWGGQLDNGTFRSRNAPPWLRTIMFG